MYSVLYYRSDGEQASSIGCKGLLQGLPDILLCNSLDFVIVVGLWPWWEIYEARTVARVVGTDDRRSTIVFYMFRHLRRFATSSIRLAVGARDDARLLGVVRQRIDELRTLQKQVRCVALCCPSGGSADTRMFYS